MFFCDLKIDGMAISIFYHSGELQQAITRGDGVVGEDLTKNIRLIESIPKTVSYQKDFEIRGEIFFPKDAFKVFNQKRKKENKPTYKNRITTLVVFLRCFFELLVELVNSGFSSFFIHNNLGACFVSYNIVCCPKFIQYCLLFEIIICLFFSLFRNSARKYFLQRCIVHQNDFIKGYIKTCLQQVSSNFIKL